jgi:hypothetical protein
MGIKRHGELTGMFVFLDHFSESTATKTLKPETVPPKPTDRHIQHRSCLWLFGSWQSF